MSVFLNHNYIDCFLKCRIKKFLKRYHQDTQLFFLNVYLLLKQHCLQRLFYLCFFFIQQHKHSAITMKEEPSVQSTDPPPYLQGVFYILIYILHLHSFIRQRFIFSSQNDQQPTIFIVHNGKSKIKIRLLQFEQKSFH